MRWGGAALHCTPHSTRDHRAAASCRRVPPALLLRAAMKFVPLADIVRLLAALFVEPARPSIAGGQPSTHPVRGYTGLGVILGSCHRLCFIDPMTWTHYILME